MENCIGVISCSDTRPEEIIMGVLDVERLPEPHMVTHGATGYLWHIETKYYSADVKLLALKDREFSISEDLEALIMHFDSDMTSSFEDADRWFSAVLKFNPEVRLLVCDNCSETQNKAVSRKNVIDWCLKNQFELVELHPDEESGGDEEDDDSFKEMKGYQRIVQALVAHTWPGLAMKDPPVYKPSKQVLESLDAEELKIAASALPNGSDVHAKGSSSTEEESSQKREALRKTQAEKIDNLLDEDRWLFDAVGKEDPGSESFESLFQRILNMKEKAVSLEGEERKMYAEKVAVEFWRALGGDEEEIAGLSSDEN